MRRLGGILGVCVLLGLTGAPAAHAQTGYFVTIAARVCDRYIDIAANKARNNLQESLRDLGPDTPYTGALAGVNVNPAVEALPPQDRCRPLVGWKFTLGQGIAGSHVNGPWGSLSVVSSPYGNDITTQDAIFERDDNGNQTTNTIAGAAEVELSLAQLTRAQAGNLWIQGGTETDPVLDQLYPGAYAFGALRCATDNVNGDNVEYIRMPTKRVYCFAYYVQPPPTAGTIVIRKQVTNPANADMTFTFGGNVSFTADHRFSLQVSNGQPASMTFYRGASNPADPATRWTADELVPDGWRLTGISCPPTAIASPVTIQRDRRGDRAARGGHRDVHVHGRARAAAGPRALEGDLRRHRHVPVLRAQRVVGGRGGERERHDDRAGNARPRSRAARSRSRPGPTRSPSDCRQPRREPGARPPTTATRRCTGAGSARRPRRSR